MWETLGVGIVGALVGILLFLFGAIVGALIAAGNGLKKEDSRG